MAEQHVPAEQEFNQSPPFADVNLFTSDAALQDAVRREGAAASWPELEAFGCLAGSAEAIELGRLANENPPRLRAFDGAGQRIDLVEFHPAYHRLMAISMRQGLHCSPHEHVLSDEPPRPGAHVARCAGSYMAAQMEAGHCCPITMTHAAVASLRQASAPARDWIPKILVRDYDPGVLPFASKSSVTIGMGMTERQGGTDVRSNTTRAEPIDGRGSGGAYRLTGQKWFLSAPMSDGFLVLAQTDKGLSCFFVPRLDPAGHVNGLKLQRLKNKLGNRSNASAEVEIAGATGFLVGEEGRGIAAIMEMVTLTRLDCAVSSAGLMRQALARAVYHASYRSVFQRKLIDQPLMRQVLADMALDVEAATALAFRLARAFDGDSDEGEGAYRRVMTPVSKYWVCKIAPALTYEAMECLGGNGYVEEGGFPRLYREVPVNAIWEGSGNVMCLDLLRVLEREPESFAQIVAELADLSAGEKRLARAVERIKSLAVEARRNPAVGRQLVELLALTEAGALLNANAPAALADAFLQTRLAGSWRQSYGAGLGFSETDAIIKRAKPHAA